MKSNILIAACLFVFIAPLSIMAQNPPDLEVFDPQFNYSASRGFDKAYFYGTSPVDKFPSQTFSYHVREISARFWNTGTKPIKSVKWEYLLFKDAQETELARVYRIHSKRKLLPGESHRLSKYGFNLQTSSHVKVRVTRIDYGDRTFWQGTNTKK
jgi:hypothetical protein